MFNKIKAFTLAEVLAVLGIIGVISALTLPNLTRDMEERKCISALRKVYPELETAYSDIVSEHGLPVAWNLANNADNKTVSKQMYDYMLEKLSVSKSCENKAGCFPSWKWVETESGSDGYYKMILKDGAALAIGMYDMSSMRTSVANHAHYTGNNADTSCNGYMGKFIVDVNGSSGENDEGYDIFEFYLCADNGFIADGDSPNGPVISNKKGATAWALKAGNRDYLKCANQLNWNTKRTCK